ncbi:hypothetical protein, partial [Rhizobium ruizarguesonis]|uniref:hypothetical protein n=1 Tax=Rhizobium ruizarguesonis TaxID=2081791 RepID=UPI001952E3E1
MKLLALFLLFVFSAIENVAAQEQCQVRQQPAYYENCNCTGHPDVRRACYKSVTATGKPCGDVCDACKCPPAGSSSGQVFP